MVNRLEPLTHELPSARIVQSSDIKIAGYDICLEPVWFSDPALCTIVTPEKEYATRVIFEYNGRKYLPFSTAQTPDQLMTDHGTTVQHLNDKKKDWFVAHDFILNADSGPLATLFIERPDEQTDLYQTVGTEQEASEIASRLNKELAQVLRDNYRNVFFPFQAYR